jgi:hypothetical protein
MEALIIIALVKCFDTLHRKHPVGNLYFAVNNAQAACSEEETNHEER